MNAVNVDRLKTVLSGILSDRFNRQITVTTREGTNGKHDSDRNDNYAGGDSRLHPLRHGA